MDRPSPLTAMDLKLHADVSVKVNVKVKVNVNVNAINRIPSRPPILVNTSPLPKSGDYFAPTQLLNDDIECGDGLIFQNLDRVPSHQFFHVPGVRKRLYKPKQAKTKTVPKNKNGKKSKLSQEQGKEQGGAQESDKWLYGGRMMISGVSINLGSDHPTSLPAAAALDIANKLYQGADNHRPYYVLSEVEVMKALGAIGYGTSVGPQEFKHSLFTQERKEYFESLVDQALSSLGGRDDLYADILCNLDKCVDKKSASESFKSSESDVDTYKRGRSRKKRKAGGAKQPDLKQMDEDLQYCGEHVIFDVNEDGKFSWRLDDCISNSAAAARNKLEKRVGDGKSDPKAK